MTDPNNIDELLRELDSAICSKCHGEPLRVLPTHLTGEEPKRCNCLAPRAAEAIRKLREERDSLLQRNAEQVKDYKLIDNANKRRHIQLYDMEKDRDRLAERVQSLEKALASRNAVAMDLCLAHLEDTGPSPGCWLCEVDELRNRLMDEHDGSAARGDALAWEKHAHEKEQEAARLAKRVRELREENERLREAERARVARLGQLPETVREACAAAEARVRELEADFEALRADFEKYARHIIYCMYDDRYEDGRGGTCTCGLDAARERWTKGEGSDG